MITKAKMYMLFSILSVVVFSYGLTDKKKVIVKMPEKGIAIVELFTSEGCSSCPPADRLLSKIASENKYVYVLSYHVDYWDHLGWKDPFSQSVFTERQRQYAQRFRLESIYTPQVVINGVEEFVGSDEQRLRSSLLRLNTLTSFDIDAGRKNVETVSISFNLKSAEATNLHIAMVQPQAVTVIKRGENSGRTLQHVNVVRKLKTLDAKSANIPVEVDVPLSLQDQEFALLIFAQAVKDNRITAASKVIIPRYDEMKKQLTNNIQN